MVRCEKCGSANTVEICFKICYQAGNDFAAVPVAQKKKVFPKNSSVGAVACTDCGAIFELRLEEPEKLRPFAGY